MLLRTSLLALVVLALTAGAVRAAESYDNCTGFIDSLPATISTQGTWCLRKDLSTGIVSGRAIVIAANNVTLDCNDFKVGNLEAGDITGARGIYASAQLGVTVRNCNVRGFRIGISLGDAGGDYRIENNRVQGSTYTGILVDGSGSILRGNAVKDIGGVAGDTYGISANGTVDLIDNSVVGMQSQYDVHGIWTTENDGGTVMGNRVRDLLSLANAYGMQASNSTGMSFRDNYIATGSGTAGLSCSSTAARAQGNTITGFTTGMTGCGDAGLNDVSP